MDSQSHDFVAPGAKVIRIPSLKRGRDDIPLDDRVKLEKVLGLTVGSNSALDCDPLSEQIAYPAGCTIVLFNSKKNKQSHILNASRKTITCLAFSPGGKYLATGECGHVPSLRVWSVQDGTQIAEFQGHKYGINCVAFSPNNKYVVSIGSQHDMIVNVWDWKNNLKVASNKVSTKVKAISFSENGKYFVTVGMRNVKFWYLEHARSAKYNEPVPLTGRSAILGEQSDNYFCDVACGRGKMGDSTYSITKSGLLCEFSIRRMLDKWVELRTRSANCMSVGENYIFIGCADGIIRCFSPMTLEFLVTLPRPHYLGVDVALGLGLSHLLNPPQDAKYPDAIALTFDDANKKLTCVYNDHSLYVWSVQEIRRVGKTHSYLFHSACIWGVEVYPEAETQKPLPVPSGSFITCSSDDTIRFWNLDSLGDDSTIYRRNIYSNELLKVIYVDKNLTYLKDLDLTNSSTEKTETSYDGKNGVRSVRISPNGQHLASGDREGNIRIHDLNNLNEMVVIEAHDAEVLCLEYTKESNENLLASASRDRLIHVFDVAKEYECIQTLDDHSSSITSVRFINNRGQLQMISCSADKSIIFRQFNPATPGGTKNFLRDHNVAGKTTLYDMEVDCNQKHILTACQDRNIRVYNVNSGKHSKTFKGSMGEDGTLIKVALDNSGIYIATSCTDKSLSIYDYYSGECMATMLGHSELVTGLRFTNDCKRLVSASGDGCIFIWRLPRDMTVTMQARLDQQAVRKGKRTVSLQSGFGITDGPKLISDEEPDPFEFDRNANVDKTAFKLNVGQLPAWARREIEDPNKKLKNILDPNDQTSPDQSIHTGFSVIKINKPPQGRWAQRIENNEIMIATFSPDKQKPANESNSKDSSLESQMERNNEFGKLQGNEGVEFDGDAEDSDIEIETHYYPISTENNSEFTVNANNIEELRRSARKYKKQQQLKKLRPNTLNVESITATSNPATSVSGSQDSDEDDLEDVSSETETPSIERSLGFGINAISTESMDLVGQRENYFKNNFENLNAENAEGRQHASGKSITSQYLVRNTAIITAVKQTKSEIEKMKKREELKKRLEDTRRTLKISGLSPSPLKASQSICDLSRFPDRGGNINNRNYESNQEEDLDDEEGLRRAISLSDLSSPPSTRPDSAQGKSNAKIGNSQNTFNNSRTTSRAQPMMRCSSMGVLNRMDPNTNMHPPENKKFAVGKGLMRPTISSQNKVTTNKAQLVANAKRRPTAISSVNLANVGVNDDSSSEETGFSRNKYSTDKNNANLNQRRQGNLGRYGSLKDLSFKAKEVTQRLTSNTTISKKNKNVEAEQEAYPDVAAAPLTKQLCSTVTTQVSQDIDNLILLHKRLLIETDNCQNRSQLEQMTEDVEKLAIETQQKLSSLTSKLKNNNSMIRNQLSSNTSNFLGNNLGLMAPNNVSSAPNSFITNTSNPNLMTNVDVSRISEMLISVVQQYTENQQNNQKN